jgi:thiamine phosphate synthase YjbQ (UPF0047 family)
MQFNKSFWLDVSDAIDVLFIGHDVAHGIRDSQTTEGLLTVYVKDGRSALILAPEGLEKDRAFKRWLKEWTEVKGEAPNVSYFSYLFGSSLTLPIIGGHLDIDSRSGLYLLDFTVKAGRRAYMMSVFSESPPQDKQQEPMI